MTPKCKTFGKTDLEQGLQNCPSCGALVYVFTQTDRHTGEVERRVAVHSLAKKIEENAK